MAIQDDDQPRHGDPLARVINNHRDREDNPAQRDSNAPADAVAEGIPPDPNDQRAVGRHSSDGNVSPSDEWGKRKEL